MPGNIPISLPTYSCPLCPFFPFSERDEDDIRTTNATVFGSGAHRSQYLPPLQPFRDGLGLRVCVSNGGRRRVLRAGRLVGWLVLDYSALGSALGSHSPKHKRRPAIALLHRLLLLGLVPSHASCCEEIVRSVHPASSPTARLRRVQGKSPSSASSHLVICANALTSATRSLAPQTQGTRVLSFLSSCSL